MSEIFLIINEEAMLKGTLEILTIKGQEFLSQAESSRQLESLKLRLIQDP
jgi:hypothetical protein